MKSKKQKTISIADDKAQYRFYSQTAPWYDDLLADISRAEDYIYIESFRIGNDAVGERLCDALSACHSRGIRVKILVDWWGTGLNNENLNNLIQKGIEVRFFKKFILSIFLFSKNHRRDHRKIVVIDDRVSYIGSANFTAYNQVWRESILRIEGQMSTVLKKIFKDNFKIYNKDISVPLLEKSSHRTIKFNNFFFIRDVPGVLRQNIKKNYIRLIQRAKRHIVIETPYFLPGRKIYSELIQAVRRGVEVNLIMPKSSDIKIVDYLRTTFLEEMHKKGVKIHFYRQNNLHAKLLFIDNEWFAIGSANIDHRSFKCMFEIATIGNEPAVCDLVNQHIQETFSLSEPFNEKEWRETPLFKRVAAFMLLPFSHLL
jgi:cardiolipin synthase